MDKDIKLVAVDVDGTFVRSDYTYDVPLFKRILAAIDKECSLRTRKCLLRARDSQSRFL